MPSISLFRSDRRILWSLAWLVSILIVTPDCGDPGSSAPESALAADQTTIGYNFKHADETHRLQKELREISGLTLLDQDHLGAVQDESGKLYVVDLHTGKIDDEIRFADDGDYEGIETVGESIFVLRSDGRLIHVARNDVDQKPRRIKTGLSRRYDTEGLAYDPTQNVLLIACKEYAGKGLKGKRAVYAFDLRTEQLREDPYLVIDPEMIRSLGGGEGRIARALRKLIDSSRFKPSAIAVHPMTNHIYIVSSVSSSIAIFDSAGSLLAAERLDKDELPQPEGITFLPNGDLFIASEGSGGRGRLARFNYRSRTRPDSTVSTND